MKYRLLFIAAFTLLGHSLSAQYAASATYAAAGQAPAVPGSAVRGLTNQELTARGPTGLWLTQDNDGVIAITPYGDALCARTAGVVLDHLGDAMPIDYRGRSQCGLQLIADARPTRPGLWQGHSLDPRNGRIYGADFRLDPNGRLLLRGFVGIPLLGRTETWTRYPGSVPPDCRLMAARGGGAPTQKRPITPG